MDLLKIVGRTEKILIDDIVDNQRQLDECVQSSRFLVIGGAGSIGQEVVKQIFQRNPKSLHVIDLSENNTAELVRDIRSSLGYITGETEFFPIDVNSREFDVFWKANGRYDYVLNLAALKHVRTEKHAYSLMRMILTNIVGTKKTLDLAAAAQTRKYFAVSSDKAQNPGNLMGATKTIMENVLFTNDRGLPCSTARFANVAFSDGSLLHAFRQRILKRQPLSAPKDIRRYFITPDEAGEICLISALFGEHQETFFPKIKDQIKLTDFPAIARAFLCELGYEAVEMDSEQEARERVTELANKRQWPCYFFSSDTSGEKPIEEFYSDSDEIDWDRFQDLAVIKWADPGNTKQRIAVFLERFEQIRASDVWSRDDIIRALFDACPTLDYHDTGRFLDSRM